MVRKKPQKRSFLDVSKKIEIKKGGTIRSLKIIGTPVNVLEEISRGGGRTFFDIIERLDDGAKIPVSAGVTRLECPSETAYATSLVEIKHGKPFVGIRQVHHLDDKDTCGVYLVFPVSDANIT